MLNSDLPIEKAVDDALNRSSFAKNLAEAMLNYDAPEGFVIGMYGKWGSGKTSVINMVLEHIMSAEIESLQKTIILRFNPWLCSDPKQLISQFFKQLSCVIKKERPELENICGYMNDYAEAFELAGLIPNAGKILTAIGKLIQKKADKKNNDLQGIKDKIIKNLRENEIKLIVTIDDIDRLTSAEIVSVFQLVKSLANFPYTVYLLAFDREVVIRSLCDVQRGDGAEYLEKIIQVPFELPFSNSSDIYQVFFDKLNATIGSIPEEKWDVEHWSKLFNYGIKGYLNTIRDVMRFANTFALKFSLLKDEVSIIDLIGLTCIQVFEPNIYTRLPFYKELLCGGTDSFSSSYREKEDKVQQAFNAITVGVSDDRSENIKNILCCLFPKLDCISDSSFYFSRYYDSRKALIDSHVSNPNRFDRYFFLSLNREEISNQALDYLLFNATKDEMMEGIRKINSAKKITKLLEYIEASFNLKKDNDKYLERAKILLECLMLLWNELEDNEEHNFFSPPFSWRLIFCANALMGSMDAISRYNHINELFNNVSIPLSEIYELLLNFEHQHNRFTDRESDTSNALLLLDEVLKLENVFTGRVLSEKASNGLIKSDSLTRILDFCEHIVGEDIKEYTDNLINSDLDLAYVVSSAVSRGKGATDRTFTIWSVWNDRLSKYVDIKDAYSKITCFVLSEEFANLNIKLQENIIAFLIYNDKINSDTTACNPMFGDGVLEAEIKEKLNDIKAKLTPI